MVLWRVQIIERTDNWGPDNQGSMHWRFGTSSSAFIREGACRKLLNIVNKSFAFPWWRRLQKCRNVGSNNKVLAGGIEVEILLLMSPGHTGLYLEFKVAASLKSDIPVSSANSLICIWWKPWLAFVQSYCYKLAFVLDSRLSSQNVSRD